jgi:peptide/nickel transport system substrate-binding protein
VCSTPSPERGLGEDVLREAFDYQFSRLDPTGDHIDPPSVAIYEPLMAKGPDWAAHAALAESWEVSNDALSWRVKIRPGAKFHSGRACDSEAVATALDHLRYQSGTERQLWYWDPVSTVETDGPETLVFRLEYPYSRLPSLLWGTHTAVYNEHARQQDPDRFGRLLADGTGPYRLLHWSPERVVAERWDQYRGPQDGFLATSGRSVTSIEWVSLLSSSDRLAALDHLEVDCMHNPPYGDSSAVSEDPRFRVHEQVQQSNIYLALDFRRVDLGFDDLRVRQAISMAIDRAALVDDALSGHGCVTYGPLPPGDEFYDASVEDGHVYDPKGAAEALDRAGWTLDGGAVRRREQSELRFECVTQDDEIFNKIAKQLRSQLARVGVHLDLRLAKPFADFYAACADGPPASISKWLWPDALDAVIGFSSSSTRPDPNWQYATVPELDDTYGRWLRAGDREELSKAASMAQHCFARALPYVPLVTPNDVWVNWAHVHGWVPYQAGLYPFYHNVTVEPRP